MSTPIAKPPTVDFLGVQVTNKTKIGNVFSLKELPGGSTETDPTSTKATLFGTALENNKISLNTNKNVGKKVLNFSFNGSLQGAEDAFKAWNFRLNENKYTFEFANQGKNPAPAPKPSRPPGVDVDKARTVA